MAAASSSQEHIVHLTNIPEIFGSRSLFALVARRLPPAIRGDGIKLRVSPSGTTAELVCKSADVAAAVAAKLAHPVIKVSFESEHAHRIASAAAADAGLQERSLSKAITNSANDAAESSASTSDGANQSSNPWRKSQTAAAPAKSVVSEPAWRYYRKGRSSGKPRSGGKAGQGSDGRGSKRGGDRQQSRGKSDVNAGAKRLVVNSLGGGRAAQRSHAAGVAAEAGKEQRVRDIQQRQDRQRTPDGAGGAFSSGAFGSTRRGGRGGRGGSRRGRGGGRSGGRGDTTGQS